MRATTGMRVDGVVQRRLQRLHLQGGELDMHRALLPAAAERLPARSAGRWLRVHARGADLHEPKRGARRKVRARVHVPGRRMGL